MTLNELIGNVASRFISFYLQEPQQMALAKKALSDFEIEAGYFKTVPVEGLSVPVPADFLGMPVILDKKRVKHCFTMSEDGSAYEVEELSTSVAPYSMIYAAKLSILGGGDSVPSDVELPIQDLLYAYFDQANTPLDRKAAKTVGMDATEFKTDAELDQKLVDVKADIKKKYFTMPSYRLTH